MRILSLSKFLSSVIRKSCDSLNIEATSPIKVASTSGVKDISAIKEFRSRGSAGVFQFTAKKFKLNLNCLLL